MCYCNDLISYKFSQLGKFTVIGIFQKLLETIKLCRTKSVFMMIINRTKSVTWHIVADHIDVTLIIYRLWSTVNFIQFTHRRNSNKHTSAKLLFKQWQYFPLHIKQMLIYRGGSPRPHPSFRIGISWLIKDWIHVWWKWLENFLDPLLNNPLDPPRLYI